MTNNTLLTKLLRFKGLRVVNAWFEGRDGFVIVVKSHKNGCRSPQSSRRGVIVQSLEPRRWRDVQICGRTVSSSTARARSAAPHTVDSWKRSPG